jgi:RNA-splicing ligase RtcB
MSRKAAQGSLSMEEYEEQMKGIYSTSVSARTLDEAPMAYKSMESIVRNIAPTAEISMRIKPVYNFKAG